MAALNHKLIRVIGLVPTVMLVVAVFDLPYGYYTFLRLVVTVAALLIAWFEWANARRALWLVLMGLIALLFNPIVPVYLTREIWFFIDLAVAAIFMVYVIVTHRGDA